MEILIKSIPSSLFFSSLKERGYTIADTVMYSNERTAMKVMKIVIEVAKTIFLALSTLPLDVFYIPIVFIAKKIWDKQNQDNEKGRLIQIDAPARWSLENGETEISVADSKQLMQNPKKYGAKKTISIPIARCDDLELNEKDFSEIIRRVNKYTLNIPYPHDDISSRYFGSMFKDTYVYRPNHNGTHSARQMRYTEALFELIEKKGTQPRKSVLSQISEEERLNVLLGSYLHRAGRIDESSFKEKSPDRVYKIRSARIYEGYARELYKSDLSKDSERCREVEKLISWTVNLMLSSSTTWKEGFCDVENTSEKDKMCRDIMFFSHEIDLIRCYSESSFNKNCAMGVLASLIGVEECVVKESYWPLFFDFAKGVCAATGVGRRYDKVPYNKKVFLECSHHGDKCLENVRSVPLKQAVE